MSSWGISSVPQLSKAEMFCAVLCHLLKSLKFLVPVQSLKQSGREESGRRSSHFSEQLTFDLNVL